MNHPGALGERGLPLVIDLDGTVLRTDLFLEGLVLALKREPWLVFLAVVWLVQGRALFKRRIAERAVLNVELLPLNGQMVSYAAACAAEGQAVYIASAADESLARRVGARLGFVKDVLASDGQRNLKAQAKADALSERFPGGFVYAGDARADLPVWRAARGGVFVGRSRSLERAAGRATTLVESLPQGRPGWRVWMKALRVHQWSKNTLVFLPLMLAGLAVQPQAWLHAVLAFAGIGLLCSSTYLLNDLLDLEDDRAHRTKCHRPLACGALPLSYALFVAPAGIVAGLSLGWLAGGAAGVACLLLYLVTTGAYSLGLKRVPMADVMIISSLFTVRLLLGALVVGAPLKPWLFVFSMFLFTALSMAKRAAEIGRMPAAGPDACLGGRGYMAADGPTVTAFGVASGVAAVLVLVLYLLNEAMVQGFYSAPELLWAAPVILTLWLGRIWLICGRGQLDDDPVAFAVKDKVSLGLGVVLGAAMLLALL